MDVLFLAAGYGTRLAKDLNETEQYKELRGVPKPLLPVSGLPLISHWMHMIKECPSLKNVYLIANENNKDKFYKWREGFPRVEITTDGTHTNEERIGAVACISKSVDDFNIKDHLVVIGGDTLFYKDFSLIEVVRKFESTPSIAGGGTLVTCCTCGENETSKFGILEVDGDGRVTSFLEKPSPEETTSRLSCPCFYMLSSSCLPLLKQFLEEHNDAPLSKRDATGNFIKYLCSKVPVYTHHVTGRFDVGNLRSYIECNENIFQI